MFLFFKEGILVDEKEVDNYNGYLLRKLERERELLKEEQKRKFDLFQSSRNTENIKRITFLSFRPRLPPFLHNMGARVKKLERERMI